MELVELRQITRKHFNRNDIDVLDMLIVLLETQSENHRIFKDGSKRDRMLMLTKAFKQAGNSLPQSMLTQAVCDKKGEAFNDIDLLEFVLADKNDYAEFLVANDFNIGDIKANIVLYQQQEKHDIKGGESMGFCENMTQNARKGRYDALFGRPNEIEAIENILLKKDKANVIITGRAGVGKTALVELLVKHSVQDQRSRLGAYTFYNLDLTMILGSALYRGEVEKRLAELLNAAKREKNAVFFIDEIHRINQSVDGRSTGSQVSEILKPYLTGGDIRIIGATTEEDYRKYFLGSGALQRRFQKLAIKELEGGELFRAVRSYAGALENYHNMTISDDVINRCIDLTNAYLPNWCQPDKTNDILDTACVSARKGNCRSIETRHLVAELSAASDIPAFIIEKKIFSTNQAANRIKQHIFGQDQQIDRVLNTLSVKMSGFRKADSPIAVFMFAGDSGVGKTELAKQVAAEVTGSKSRLTIVDMSEFSERHTVSKLIGSPPGYVDSDQEGIIPSVLSSDAYHVFVFDEIEKAAPEIHRLLLGMMDTGRIRSGLGRSYDAKHTIIIFTTNAVTKSHLNKKAIGFGGEHNRQSDAVDSLKRSFPSEFLGRIDDIVVFNSLSHEDYRRIIDKELQCIQNELMQRGIRAVYEAEDIAKRLLGTHNSTHFGAREIINIIRGRLLTKIIHQIGEGSCKSEINLNEMLDMQSGEMIQDMRDIG